MPVCISWISIDETVLWFSTLLESDIFVKLLVAVGAALFGFFIGSYHIEWMDYKRRVQHMNIQREAFNYAISQNKLIIEEIILDMAIEGHRLSTNNKVTLRSVPELPLFFWKITQDNPFLIKESLKRKQVSKLAIEIERVNKMLDDRRLTKIAAQTSNQSINEILCVAIIEHNKVIKSTIDNISKTINSFKQLQLEEINCFWKWAFIKTNPFSR